MVLEGVGQRDTDTLTILAFVTIPCPGILCVILFSENRMGHEKMGIKDGFYFLFRYEWMRRVIYIVIISVRKFKKKSTYGLKIF